MPPALLAVAPAAIGALGVLGGAALSSRASNKATEASTKSTDKVLAYTKEQEALAKADYERRLDDYYASRDALLSRYGVTPPTRSAPMPQPPGAQPRAAMPGTMASPGLSIPAAMAAANMPAPQGVRAAGVPPERMSNVEDVLSARRDGTDWSNWERYGLRQA